jgi:hypothetical protein
MIRANAREAAPNLDRKLAMNRLLNWFTMLVSLGF